MDGERDNPINVSGEVKDRADFKQNIQSRADRHDTTRLFEGGRALSLFFAQQIKEKTGSIAERKKALTREVDPKKDSHHASTSCDDYTDEALKEWCDERDFGTDLQLSLNRIAC
jgi:hypothetical protein